MDDLKNILISSFSNSAEEMRMQYEYLQDKSQEERETIVNQANRELTSVKNDINSTKTKNNIRVLLKYQYETRFVLVKYKYELAPNVFEEDQSKRYFIEQILNKPYYSSENPISSFFHEVPDEKTFIELIIQELKQKDFYSTINIVCNDLYGISFPSNRGLGFNNWLECSGLLEESWDWKYKECINKWSNSWFKPNNKIKKAKQLWSIQKERSEDCLQYIQSNFNEIADAEEWLSSLKKSEVRLNVSVSNINKVYSALNEGTKLKHLLLEEGIEAAKVFSQII